MFVSGEGALSSSGNIRPHRKPMIGHSTSRFTEKSKRLVSPLGAIQTAKDTAAMLASNSREVVAALCRRTAIDLKAAPAPVGIIKPKKTASPLSQPVSKPTTMDSKIKPNEIEPVILRTQPNIKTCKG